MWRVTEEDLVRKLLDVVSQVRDFGFGGRLIKLKVFNPKQLHIKANPWAGSFYVT
jgi:hypothetical protein